MAEIIHRYRLFFIFLLMVLLFAAVWILLGREDSKKEPSSAVFVINAMQVSGEI